MRANEAFNLRIEERAQGSYCNIVVSYACLLVWCLQVILPCAAARKTKIFTTMITTEISPTLALFHCCLY